jgi:hypothetical protein
MKSPWVLALVISSSFLCCHSSNEDISHTLVITSDFNSVRRCATPDEVNTVARIMISARPDILALDVTACGLVNYRSEIGSLIPGSRFDAMLEAGYEPYQLIVDTLRANGITVLANVRMNDHHGRLVYWTPWERNHRAWSLGEDTGSRDWKSIGALRQMDYAVEGVRSYRFSILAEILEKFEVDGLQLDFGRTAPFLSEPKTQNARYMTGYVRGVRRLLDETARKQRRGHMMLGVTVPWDVDFCTEEGLHIQQWIDEELVDYVSPGEWYYADWNIPLDRWRTMTQGTDCKLYPFTPGNVSPYQVFEYGERSLLGDNRVLDPPKIRAIADNFMSQGPDGFAFYNFYTFDFGKYYPRLRTWTNPRQTGHMSKQFLHCRRPMYHCSERETFDSGVAFERLALVRVGDRVELPFRFSTSSTASEALLRCAIKHLHPTDEVVVRLNGHVLTPDTVKSVRDHSEGYPDVLVGIWEGTIALRSLRSDDNIIEWELVRADPKNDKEVAVGEFEIVIEP